MAVEKGRIYRRRCTAIAAVLWVTSAGIARADLATNICTILGPLAQYQITATQYLKAREYFPNAYALPNAQIGDSVCAPNIRSGKVATWWNDVVATAPTGTAIEFGVMLAPLTSYYLTPYLCGHYDGYPCSANEIFGDLVTGGGAIKARGDVLPVPYGGHVIDTTGSHPQVGECTAALQHAIVASAALAQGLLPGEPPASARPIIDVGDIFVAREDTLTLSATPGAPVTIYRARNVKLGGGKVVLSYNYSYVTDGGRLALSGDPDQVVVLIATGSLRLGRRAFVESDAGATVVNLIGTGPGVVIQRGEFGGVLLAPQRNVRFRALGGGSEAYYAVAGQVFGRKVSLTGSAATGEYWNAVDRELCGFPPVF